MFPCIYSVYCSLSPSKYCNGHHLSLVPCGSFTISLSLYWPPSPLCLVVHSPSLSPCTGHHLSLVPCGSSTISLSLCSRAQFSGSGRSGRRWSRHYHRCCGNPGGSTPRLLLEKTTTTEDGQDPPYVRRTWLRLPQFGEEGTH